MLSPLVLVLCFAISFSQSSPLSRELLKFLVEDENFYECYEKHVKDTPEGSDYDVYITEAIDKYKMWVEDPASTAHNSSEVAENGNTLAPWNNLPLFQKFLETQYYPDHKSDWTGPIVTNSPLEIITESVVLVDNTSVSVVDPSTTSPPIISQPPVKVIYENVPDVTSSRTTSVPEPQTIVDNIKRNRVGTQDENIHGTFAYNGTMFYAEYYAADDRWNKFIRSEVTPTRNNGADASGEARVRMGSNNMDVTYRINKDGIHNEHSTL